MPKFIITAVLQLQAPRNLQSIVNQINRQLAGIQANINVNINQNASNQIKNLASNINAARKTVNNFSNDIEKAGFQAGKTLRRYAGFTIATGAFISLGRAISAGISDALEYEKTLNKIRQVTGTSAKDLGGLNNEITKLATSFGVSSSKIAESALTISQAGLSAEKTRVALEALTKTELTATFDDIKDTTEGAIAVFQQFNIEAQDLEKVLGSINTVSAKFAVESADIVTAIRRTGGAFQAAGGNLNELMALFTSVRQTTRESAESIATGFRTIFTRLQRTKTQDFLKTLGIDVTDIQGQFIGPYEAVRKLSDALKNIGSTDPRFSQIVEELGGFRQVSKVIPLIQKFDVAQRALNIAQRSGNSVSEDAAKAQDTLSNKISKVKEEFAALLRTIAQTSTFQAFVEVALSLSSALIKLTSSLAPIIPLLAAFATMKIGSSIGSFGKGFIPGIKGFATGGLVPGSGSGDTVPAMLTPGEFVMKKSAVKSVGAMRLAKLNGMSTGNTVDPVKASLLSQLDEYDITPKRQQAIANFLINNNIDNLDNSLARKKLEGAQKRQKKQTEIVDKKNKIASGELQNITIGSEANPAIAGLYVTNKGDGTDLMTINQGTLSPDVRAYLKQKTGLEEFNKLQIPLQSSFIQEPTKNRIEQDFPNDYVGLVNNAAKKVLPHANFTTSNINKSQLNAVGGYFFENIISSITKQFSEEGAGFDFRPAGKAIAYKALFGDNYKDALLADAKYEKSKNVDEKIKGKAITELSNKDSPLYKVIHPQHFANGGSVDSVPAMLTPGEFVINKSAASKIGKSRLESMNRGVKHFATGGAVGGLGNTIAQNPEKAFFVVSLLTSLAAQFAKTNKVVESFANVITSATLQFSVLSTVVASMSQNPSLKNIKDKFSGLSKQKKITEDTRGTAKERGIDAIELAKAKKIRERETRFGPGSSLAYYAAETQINYLKEKRAKRIADRKASIAKEQRISDRADKISNLSVIGGSLASAGGQALQENALAKINRGQSTDRTQATIGGGLSGAGQGAAIGSAAGPYGALAGGIIGAGIGVYNAFTDAADAISKVEFDKRIAPFLKSLDKISSGKASSSSQAFNVNSGIRDINNRLLTATGDQRESVKGQASNSVVGIETFLNKLAGESKNIAQFTRTAGVALNFFAQETQQTIQDVTNSYKKIIEANEKALKIDKDLIELRVKEYTTLRSSLSIETAFDRASSAADRLFDNFSSLVDVVNGTVSGLSSNDNSFKGTDLKAINSQSSAIGNIFGDSAKGSIKQFQEVARLRQELPDILLSLKNKSPLDGEGFTSSLVDKIRGRGFENQDLVNNVRTMAKTKLVGGEGKDVEAINELFRDINGAAADLTRGFDGLGKILEDSQDKINDFLNKFNKGLLESVKLQQQERKAKLNSIDIEEKIAEILAGINDTPVDSIGFENRRKTEVTDGKSVAKLQGIIDTSNTELGKLRDKEKNTFDVNGRADLNKKIIEQENAVVQATEALNFLADVTSRTSAIMKDLEKLKVVKSFAFNLGKTLVTGTAQEQRNAAKGIFGASKIRQNQSTAGLSQSEAAAGIDLLLQLGEAIPKFKEDAKNAISNDLQNRGLTKDQADKVASKKILSEEEKLAEALKPVLAESKAAGEAVAKLFATTNGELIKKLDTTLSKFITDLQKTFDESNRASKEKRLAELGNEKGLLIEQHGKARRLDDIKELTNATSTQDVLSAIPKVQDLKKLQIQKNKLFTGSINTTGITDKKSDISATISSGKLFKELTNVFSPDKAKSIIDTFQAKIAETKGPEVANANEILSKIIRAEKIATKDNLNANIGELKTSISELLPKNTDNIIRKIKDIANALAGLPAGENTASISAKIATINEEEKRLKRNSGGGVPGIGSTDTIPAMLTPGEFVIRKAAVEKIGLDNLHAMNATGFAHGGFASSDMRFANRQEKRAILNSQRVKNGKISPDKFLRELRVARNESRADAANARFGTNKYDRLTDIKLMNESAKPTYLAKPKKAPGIYRNGVKIGDNTGNVPTGNLSTGFRYTKNTPTREEADARRAAMLNGKQTQPLDRQPFRYTSRAEIRREAIKANRGHATGGVVGGSQGGSGSGGGGLTINSQSLETFNRSVNQFSTSSERLSTSLDNFPREITMSANHKVEVIVNGAQVLSSIMPEIQNLVVAETKNSLNNFIKTKMPDVGEIQ